MKKTSIYTIAHEAGVSTATVSKVLNRQGKISRDTTDRVMKIIKANNYVPRQRKTGGQTIGILTFCHARTPVSSPFTTQLLNGICLEAFAQKKNITLIDGNSMRDLSPEEIHCFAITNSLAGYLIINLPWEDPFLEKLQKSRIPFVLGANNAPDKSECSYVTTNNYDAVTDLVDYMICLGHTRIAYVGLATTKFISHRERLRAYGDILKKHNIESRSEYVLDLPNADFGTIRNSLMRLLSRPNPPTALFYASEELVKIFFVLKNLQISVPEELSVAGMQMGQENFQPEISAIIQPTEEIGRESVRILMHQIETGESRGYIFTNYIYYGETVIKHQEEA